MVRSLSSQMDPSIKVSKLVFEFLFVKFMLITPNENVDCKQGYPHKCKDNQAANSFSFFDELTGVNHHHDLNARGHP